MLNKTLRYEEGTIHYRITGKGPVVMLVHGFGENSDVWDGLANALASSFRVILPELPGSGRSSLIPDMTMSGQAEVLHGILNQEEATKAILIGHSMGGYITLAFAEKYMERLQAFGLYHSTAYADTEEKKATRRKGIQFIREHGAFEFLKTTIPNLFSTTTREKHPDIPEKQIAGLRNFSDEKLVLDYEAMIIRPDRRDVLKTSPVPILFLAGTSDNAIPLADVLEQCHLPDLSYIHVLKQSGHMGMLEEPEESTQIVKEFLLQQTK